MLWKRLPTIGAGCGEQTQIEATPRAEDLRCGSVPPRAGPGRRERGLRGEDLDADRGRRGREDSQTQIEAKLRAEGLRTQPLEPQCER
jgi:hypothetical protein